MAEQFYRDHLAEKLSCSSILERISERTHLQKMLARGETAGFAEVGRSYEIAPEE